MKKVILYPLLLIVLIIISWITFYEFFKTCGNCEKPLNVISNVSTSTIPISNDYRNYTIVYSTNNGSLPPPYHKEYVLTASEDTSGTVTAKYDTRDYTKILETKVVSISSTQFNGLIKAARSVNQGQPNSLAGCTGGSSEGLTVSVGGKEILDVGSYHCASKTTNESLDKFSIEIGNLITNSSVQ